jgi:hypothetical protein
MFKMGYLVVGKVEHAKCLVGLQSCKFGYRIVREVELFKLRERGETSDFGEAVGLDGDDAEV